MATTMTILPSNTVYFTALHTFYATLDNVLKYKERKNQNEKKLFDTDVTEAARKKIQRLAKKITVFGDVVWYEVEIEKKECVGVKPNINKDPTDLVQEDFEYKTIVQKKRLIIPKKNQIQEIVLHNHLVTGHGGRDSTVAKIHEKYGN